MVDAVYIPKLVLFRTVPDDLTSKPPLASSLQMLETCYFLIGLWQFPSAFVSCAAAWESALRAAFSFAPEQPVSLEDLLKQAKSQSARLDKFDDTTISHFRKTRNRLVHLGFSASDDEKCAKLLIEVGLPFLKICYEEFFDLFLDWRDVNRMAVAFNDLTSDESARVGLRPEVSDQLHLVGIIYRRALSQSGPYSVSQCFRPLSLFIRLGLKFTSRTEAEREATDYAAFVGVNSDYERERKQELAAAYRNTYWAFDCPICNGVQTLIAELAFDEDVVGASRCACVECDFIVGTDARYVSEAILETAIIAEKSKILAAYRPARLVSSRPDSD